MGENDPTLAMIRAAMDAKEHITSIETEIEEVNQDETLTEEDRAEREVILEGMWENARTEYQDLLNSIHAQDSVTISSRDEADFAHENTGLHVSICIASGVSNAEYNNIMQLLDKTTRLVYRNY